MKTRSGIVGAMATETEETETKKKAGIMLPLIVGVMLAILAGAGGYWAVTAGPFGPDETALADDDTASEPEMPGPDVVFIPLEPVIISLGPEVRGQHLMFTAHLEVATQYEDEVTHLVPRVLDVLNSYLRVIDLEEVSEPTSLAILRAQILRRIQVVTGPGRVQDLLVTQFVVN